MPTTYSVGGFVRETYRLVEGVCWMTPTNFFRGVPLSGSYPWEKWAVDGWYCVPTAASKECLACRASPLVEGVYRPMPSSSSGISFWCHCLWFCLTLGVDFVELMSPGRISPACICSGWSCCADGWTSSCRLFPGPTIGLAVVVSPILWAVHRVYDSNSVFLREFFLRPLSYRQFINVHVLETSRIFRFPNH